MKFENKYIVQAIIVAANNLRLSSEKIEVVSILKHHLSETKDIYAEIQEMKKITELSKLAIKFGQLHNYISSEQIDFLEISEKFKEHCHSFVMELNNMLDSVNPFTFREIISRINHNDIDIEISSDENRAKALDQIEITPDMIDGKLEVQNINLPLESIEERIIETENEKQELIMEELNDEEENGFDFENFEENILQPIKGLENFLKNIGNGDIESDELLSYEELMLNNAKYSTSVGFDIIANMHKIVAYTFKRIRLEKIDVNQDVIEAIRACLIVIVAVVRGKDVDITSYLKRAEEFGNYILSIK